MPNMSLGGYVFNIDPSSASWTCRMNTRSFDTYGGRVVQVLSCRTENLTLTGYITSRQRGSAVGVGGDLYQWESMEEFEANIKAIMEEQVSKNSPVHFSYPTLGWDAEVWLSGYSNVEYDPKRSAVSYTLALTIDTGLAQLADGSSQSVALNQIKNGVNWVRSKYNTPSGENAQTAIKALEKALNSLDDFNADNEADIWRLMEEVGSETVKDKEDAAKKTDGVKDEFLSSDSVTVVRKASGGATALFNNQAVELNDVDLFAASRGFSINTVLLSKRL